MADASKSLPVSHSATNNQLWAIRFWHERQIEFLQYNSGKSRDTKGIIRSTHIIATVDYILSGAAFVQD